MRGQMRVILNDPGTTRALPLDAFTCRLRLPAERQVIRKLRDEHLSQRPALPTTPRLDFHCFWFTSSSAGHHIAAHDLSAGAWATLTEIPDTSVN